MSGLTAYSQASAKTGLQAFLSISKLPPPTFQQVNRPPANYSPQARSTCFCRACELRMVFVFSKGYKKRNKERTCDQNHMWPTRPRIFTTWAFPESLPYHRATQEHSVPATGYHRHEVKGSPEGRWKDAQAMLLCDPPASKPFSK